MNIIVTGSGGVLGKPIIQRLYREGHSIYGLDRIGGYRSKKIDIFDLSGMSDYFQSVKPQRVYHLASVVGRVNSESQAYHSVNVSVLGTVQVAHLCLKHNAEMIFFSTSEIYGNVDLEKYSAIGLDQEDLPAEPINAYGTAKLMAEKYLLYLQRVYGLKLMIIRPFMIYGGEHDSRFRSVLSRFLWDLKEGRESRLDAGCHRSWCYVDDFTEGVKDFKEGIYNIGNSSELISIEDLYRRSVRISGMTPRSKVSADPPNNITVRSKNPNFARAERKLGFKAKISLNDGLRREWSRINGT